MRRKGFRPADEGFGVYLSWRKYANPRVHRALELYARYCNGQWAGMGEVLSVQAIQFACQAERLPCSRWREVTEEMFTIHEVVLARMERSKKAT